MARLQWPWVIEYILNLVTMRMHTKFSMGEHAYPGTLVSYCVCVYWGYVLILRQITGKIPLRRENFRIGVISSTASTRMPDAVVSVDP